MTAPVDEPIIRPGPAPATSGPPRRAPRTLILSAVITLVGCCLFVLGLPAHMKAGRPVGANLPINDGAGDPRDISANNSPSLAANPVDRGNLALSNRIDLPRFSCALHVTFDAGERWTTVPVPFPEGEEAPARCYAPDVAYATDGTLYVSYVTLKGVGNSPNALWVVSSTDGGRTLSTPVRVTGSLAFQARLSIDRTRPDRLYLSWLQADDVGILLFPTTGNPIEVARSDDHGATWGPPVRVSPAGRERVVAPTPAAGSDGQLSILYLDVGDDRLDYNGGHEGRGGEPYPGTWSLVLARSDDEGQSWQETVVAQALQPTQRFVVFLPPVPALAVDPKSGTMYAAFSDGRLGDADVLVWASADGGRSFGPGRRVNDTPAHDGTAQYLPQLAVAPNGRLDVVYYDRRDDRANIMNGVSLQSSSDHGRTFSPRVRVSDRLFDSRVGFGSERDFADLGSRIALVSTPQRALAVWTDTRAGTDVTGKQDLGSAIVVAASCSTRWWQRGLGLFLIIAGVAGVGVGAARRHRP